MFRIIKERMHQGHCTLDYPREQPQLSSRYCGKPVISAGHCPPDCVLCREACPTGALRPHPHGPSIDMGRCLFCAQCRDACPAGRISFSQDHRLAARTREALYVQPAQEASALEDGQSTPPSPPAQAVRDLRLFARSFKLRQVSAGGCNACEADCNVLTTLVFDLGRFGIDFVASPRHADALLITGPVSENMHQALWDSYEALPAPRVVIAVGACAISGGLFAGSAECHDGVPKDMPVDVYIPGCPPNPWTILNGLLLPFAGQKNS